LDSNGARACDPAALAALPTVCLAVRHAVLQWSPMTSFPMSRKGSWTLCRRCERRCSWPRAALGARFLLVALVALVCPHVLYPCTQTVKAMLHFAPKLHTKELDSHVSKAFARLQACGVPLFTRWRAVVVASIMPSSPGFCVWRVLCIGPPP
jgi:hypothetical protein